MSLAISDGCQNAKPNTDYELNVVLLRELHHRVANTFTMMAASLRREFAPYRETKLWGAIDRHEQFISAHGDLYRCLMGGAAETVDVDVFFTRLAGALGKALLDPMDVLWHVACDSGLLDARRYERLALVLTELVMNAAKHAFAGQAHPTLSIVVRRLSCSWSCIVLDNGCGLPDGQLIGQGWEIVEVLVRSLNGSVDLLTGPAGTEVTVRIPD